MNKSLSVKKFGEFAFQVVVMGCITYGAIIATFAFTS